MEKKKVNKWVLRSGLILILMWLLVATLMLLTSADTSGTGSTGDNGFSWSWDLDNKNTGADGSFSGTLTDKKLSLNIGASSSTYIPQKTNTCGDVTQEEVFATRTINTATVTNKTGSTIMITSITANAAKCQLSIGSMLANESTFTVTITATPTSTTSTTSETVNGSVIIEYKIVENAEVTYYGANGVSYDCNGVILDAASSSTMSEFVIGSSVTLPAEPMVESGSFYGWRLSHDGSLHAAGDTITVTEDTSVYPVVVSDGQTQPFTVNGMAYYYWIDAIIAAGANGTVVLSQENYTLPASLEASGVSPMGSAFVIETDSGIEYVIPSGVKVLIPYSEENIFRGKPTEYNLQDWSLTASNFPDPPEVNIVSGKVWNSTPNVEYCRLTLAEGTHITVNGSLEVSGQTHPLASGQWGNYAVLQMGSNTSITVGSTGTLYAYGFVRGNGTVTVESGGVVYEHYDVADYPPGGAGGLDPMNSAGVFGMTNYAFNNVEVPTTYNAGAELRAYLVMTGYNIGTNAFIRTFIGSDGNAIFNLRNGTITKTYSGGRQNLVVAGDMEFNKFYINIKMSVMGYDAVNYTVDSSKTSGLPISHNWDITVTENSTITLNGSLLMYAGSTVTVDNGSKIVIPSGVKLSLLDPGSDPSAVTANAVLDVNGEIQVDGGFYNSYSDTGIPVIKSSKGTGKVIVNSVGTETTFNVRASGDSTAAVNITPAQLQNADGSYLETSKGGANTYTYSNGKWSCKDHKHDNACDPECNVCKATRTTEHRYSCNGVGDWGDYTSYSETYSCDYCQHEITITTTNITKDETVPPSCTSEGKATYTAVMEDARIGTKTVTKENVPVPTVDHTYGDDWESDESNHWQVCTVCGYDTPPQNHVYEGDSDATCDCGYNRESAHTHNYTTEVTEPTCTEEGYTTYTCAGCGDVYVDNKTPVVDHQWETATPSYTWSQTEEGWTCTARCYCTLGKHFEEDTVEGVRTTKEDATCTVDGWSTYTATFNNGWATQNTKDVQDIKAPGQHTPGADATCTTDQICTVCKTVLMGKISHSWQEATCTAPKTCSVCGTTEGEALGHDLEHFEAKDATCTEQGNLECYVCKNGCQMVFVDEDGQTPVENVDNLIISVLGHDWADATCTAPKTCKRDNCDATEGTALGHTEGAAATCTENQICTVCGVTITAALGHNLEDVTSKAATCTEDGYSAHKACSRCDYTEGKEVVPAAHTPGAAATCTTAQTCTVCGAELQAALGHKAGAEADCENAQTCTVCGETITAALGHNLEDVTSKAATCTEDGYSAHKACSRCDYTKGKEVVPAAHTPGAAATCTTAQTCTVCGAELNAALGHTPGAAATCTEDQTCTVCEEVLAEKVGHNLQETEKKDSTCTEPGVKAYWYCDSCETYYSDEHATEKIGNADKLATWKTEGGKIAAAHKPGADGHCTACGAVTCNHAGTLTSTDAKEAACTENGNYAYWYCSACEEYFKNAECTEMYNKNEQDWIIPELGHKDADSNHVCDNGCNVPQGTCEDVDKDHACDYGCDKVYGTCEDVDKDHACDYGCDKVYGTCEDKPGDGKHYCEYCGKTDFACSDNDVDYLCDECGENVCLHEMQFVAYEAATCAKEGTVAHYFCTICHVAFEDELGNQKIADVTIGKLSHIYEATYNWSDDAIPALTVTLNCSECDDAAEGHTVVLQAVDGEVSEEFAGNCTEISYVIYSASTEYLGQTYPAETKVYGALVPDNHDFSALAHDNEHTWTACSRCDEEEPGSRVERKYTVIVYNYVEKEILKLENVVYGTELTLEYSKSNVFEFTSQAWRVGETYATAEQIWTAFGDNIPADKTELIVKEVVTGTLKPGMLQMAVDYNGANSENAMTVDFFINVDSLAPEFMPVVEFLGNDAGVQMIHESINMYYVSITLSAYQITQGGENVKITIDYPGIDLGDEAGDPDRTINSVLIAYEEALRKQFGDVEGNVAADKQEAAINAMLNYGKTVQMVFADADAKDIDFKPYEDTVINKYKQNISVNDAPFTSEDDVTFTWQPANVNFETEYSIRYKFALSGDIEGYSPENVQLIVKNSEGRIHRVYENEELSLTQTDTGYSVTYPVPASDLTMQGTTVQVILTLSDKDGHTKEAMSSEMNYGMYAYMVRTLYRLSNGDVTFTDKNGEDKSQEYIYMLVSLIQLGESVNAIYSND